MSNLSQIKADSNWGDASNTINTNFQNMDVEVEKLKNSTTRFKGYFTNETNLKNKFPSPKRGDIAFVGEPYPGNVYDVLTDGSWHNTTKAPETGNVDLQDYVTKDDFEASQKEQDDKLSELENETLIISPLSVISFSIEEGGVRININRGGLNLVTKKLNIEGFEITQNEYIVPNYSVLVLNNQTKKIEIIDSFKGSDDLYTNLAYVEDNRVISGEFYGEFVKYTLDNYKKDDANKIIVSPYNGFKFEILEDKSIKITCSRTSYNIFDEYIKKLENVTFESEYILPKDNALVINGNNVEIISNFSPVDKKITILAFNDSGFITNGLLSEYFIQVVNKDTIDKIIQSISLKDNLVEIIPSNIISNKYIEEDNTEKDNTFFDIYEYDVSESINVSLFCATGGGYGVFLDNSDSVLHSFQTKYNSEYIIIEKPKEAIKLRVSQAKPNRYTKALPISVKSDNINFNNSIVYKKSLYGKKVLFIGDSITDMAYWVNWFVKLTGCIAYNRGVSGTTYTKNDVVLNSFCERLDKEHNNNQNDKGQGFPSPENVDLIIILGGVNDFGRQSYINGKYGDIKEAIDNTTFCGALRYFFKGLKEKYTDTPIYVLSMLHTYSDSTYSLWSEINYEDDDDTKSYTVNTTSEGKTFYDYKNAIEEVSKMYGIEYIDMFRCGFSALITSEREKYYEDGLHPNELGGYIMAMYVIKHILFVE